MTMNHQLLLCCAADIWQDPHRGEGFEGVLSSGCPSKSGNTLFTATDLPRRIHLPYFLTPSYKTCLGSRLSWLHRWDRIQTKGSTGGHSASLASVLPASRRALLYLGCKWGHHRARREQGWEAGSWQCCPPTCTHLSQGEDRG